jgi:hypothetical protein
LLAVQADLYLHSFRGSNNRLDEANRDRANGNRLFDSQNNNRGGYNAGSVYYEQDSRAYFQWTAQHSCGAANNKCELIIQYMCDDLLRDGASTNRIPDNNNNCYNYDCDTDLEYGRQESMDWWYTCSATHRNKGLFTANQNVKGNDARYTRQNPNANRHGYECAEERDYYPYWRPTPWTDMAILTNDPQRCAAYQKTSENVMGRWYCEVPQQMYDMNKMMGTRGWIPIEQEACELLYWQDPVTSEFFFAKWVQAEPKTGVAPECLQNHWSRDNHLGNIIGGYMASYNWTVNMPESETCAFRVRYNITTSEYEAWEDVTSVEVGTVDWKNNSLFAEPDREPAQLSVWEKYHIDYSEIMDSFDRSLNNNQDNLVHSREYVFKNNPKVDIFGELLSQFMPDMEYHAKLQLNINTNQFGRTFQDRSHRFAVRAANPACKGTTTHNLQVRGKRGNIVQTFPGMEYDFVPDRLDVQVGECVHIQWTGSNTNPNNNAGQGKQGTDRSNMVLLADPVYFEEGQVPGSYHGQFGRSFPTWIPDTSFLGLSDDLETKLAILEPHLGGEMSELDDAGTYFDLGSHRMDVAGIYHYLCTRNNNFSNRSQKGKVTISLASTNTRAIGWNGGEVWSNTAEAVMVEEGTFTQAVDITIQTWAPTNNQRDNHNIISNYVAVHMAEEGPFTIHIPHDDLWSIYGTALWYNPNTDGTLNLEQGGWREITDKARFKNGVATGDVSGSGIYVVSEGSVDAGLAILFTGIGLAALGGGFYAWKKHQNNELSCPF